MSYLNQAVALWVVSCRRCVLDAQLPAEDAPDLGGKLRPLSEVITACTPNWATQAAMSVSAQVAATMSCTGAASIHLVDLSIMVIMYDHPSADVGSGPTRSMCMWLNRRLGTGMGCTSAAGCLVVLLLLLALAPGNPCTSWRCQSSCPSTRIGEI